MEVETKVTFGSEEILDMCRTQLVRSGVQTGIPGSFELSWGCYGSREVIAEFVPTVADEPQPAAVLAMSDAVSE